MAPKPKKVEGPPALPPEPDLLAEVRALYMLAQREKGLTSALSLNRNDSVSVKYNHYMVPSIR